MGRVYSTFGSSVPRWAAMALTAALALSGVLLLSTPVAHAAAYESPTMSISVKEDGVAPFDDLDTGAHNGVVRSYDAVTYTVNLNYGSEQRVSLRGELPLGMQWDIASATASTVCNVSSAVSPDGNVFTCVRDRGTQIAGSETFEFKAYANVLLSGRYPSPAGKIIGEFEANFVVTGHSSEAAPVTAPSPSVQVAAEPRNTLYHEVIFLKSSEYAGEPAYRVSFNNDLETLPGTAGKLSFVGSDVIEENFSYQYRLPAAYLDAVFVANTHQTAPAVVTFDVGDGAARQAELDEHGYFTLTVTVQPPYTRINNNGRAVTNFRSVAHDFYAYIPHSSTAVPSGINAVEHSIVAFEPESRSGVPNSSSAPTSYTKQVMFDTEQLLILSQGQSFIYAGNSGSAPTLLPGDFQGYYNNGSGNNHETVLPGQEFRYVARVINTQDSTVTASGIELCYAFDNRYQHLNDEVYFRYSNTPSVSSTPASIIPATVQSSVFYGVGAVATASTADQRLAQLRAFDCDWYTPSSLDWYSHNDLLAAGYDLADVTAIQFTTELKLLQNNAVIDEQGLSARSLGLFLPMVRSDDAVPAGEKLHTAWHIRADSGPQDRIEDLVENPDTGELQRFIRSSATRSVPYARFYDNGTRRNEDVDGQRLGMFVVTNDALFRAPGTWQSSGSGDASTGPGSVINFVVQPKLLTGVAWNELPENTEVTVCFPTDYAAPENGALEALVQDGRIADYEVLHVTNAAEITQLCQGRSGQALPSSATVLKLDFSSVLTPAEDSSGMFFGSSYSEQFVYNFADLVIPVVISDAAPNTAQFNTITQATMPGDPSALVYEVNRNDGSTRTNGDLLVISGVASFSGNKSATTATPGQVGSGEIFEYTISWMNNESDVTGRATFVDMLPFDGDGRGTQGMFGSSLTVLDVTAATNNPATMGGVTIEYTTDPAEDVALALAEIGNEDGATGITWSTTKPSGTITALRITTERDVEPGFGGAAHIRVQAPSLGAQAQMVNTIIGRSAPVSGDPSTVKVFRSGVPVVLESAAENSLAGTVFTDLDFDSAFSTDDGFFAAGSSAMIARGTEGQGTFTTAISSTGRYIFNDLPAGEYELVVADPHGWVFVAGTDLITIAAGEELNDVDLLYQEELAPTTLVDDEASTQADATVIIPIYANDTISLPTEIAPSVPIAPLVLDTLPQYGEAEIASASPFGILASSADVNRPVLYTPPAVWPAAFEDDDSFDEVFSYSWVDISGQQYTAKIIVTVNRPVVTNPNPLPPVLASTGVGMPPLHWIAGIFFVAGAALLIRSRKSA